MSQPAFYLPKCIVSTNGNPIDLSKQLIRVVIFEETNFKNDRIEIELNDIPNIAQPADGQKIDIQIGYEDDPHGLYDHGSFFFDEVEIASPPETIKFTAHALDTKSPMKGYLDNSYHKQTIGQIIATIAQKHGLNAIVDPAIASMMIQHRDQMGQSDLDFLTRMGLEFNFMVKIKNGQLIVAPRGLTTALSGQPVTSTSIDISDVLNWKFIRHSRGAYDGSQSKFVDQNTGEERTVTQSGGDGETNTGTQEVAPSEEEAALNAFSKLMQVNRSRETFHFTMPGNGAMTPEGFILLTGFRADIPTTWLIDKIEHIYSGEAQSGAYKVKCTCILPESSTSSISMSSSVNTASGASGADKNSTDGTGDHLLTQEEFTENI